MSSKSPSTRKSKTPLNHLKSKKWWFPPSPLRQSPGGTTTQAVGNASPPPKSPEPNCAICLGKIEDKSFTDRCFHCFCRLCLFEWAKVKAECPVCRQAFEKIIYNIRAMDDYDEQVIQTAHRHRFGAFAGGPFPFTPFVNLDGNPRFRYPTTLTPLRRRMMDFERRYGQMHYHFGGDYGGSNFPQFLDIISNRRAREQSMPSGSRRSAALRHAILNNNNSLRNSSNSPMELRSSRSSASVPTNGRYPFRDEDPMVSGQSTRQWSPIGPHMAALYDPLSPNPFELDIYPPPPGTSAHRRYIYESELYVLTNGDGNTQRTREVSARFFSSNPACTHRLIPWLNRELNSILNNPTETETLIPRIMNALLMYDITSVGFKKIIAPFTLTKTDHFVHEFYNFARSPYDMEQYTRISVYVPKHRADVVHSEPLTAPIGFHVEPTSDPSSPDSLSSSGSSIEILDAPSSPNRRTNRGIASLSPTLSLNVYSIDGSDSEDSTEIRQLITPSPVNTPSLPATETASTRDVSSISNPTPLPRGDLPDVNFGNIDIIDDFDNPKPGTSGLSQRIRSLAETKWSDSETTDVDVGQELDAAIARFENDNKTEVKKEETEKTRVEDNGQESDSDGSSVLIVGYLKPLHERTPEFVDLISSEEENQLVKSEERSKGDKKDKHRKRSNRRSRSHDSHSKRKCKHKSRDRSKHRERHKHKSRRHSRHYRPSSSSSSSTSSFGSSSDEMRQFSKKFKRRRERDHPCKRYSNPVPTSLYGSRTPPSEHSAEAPLNERPVVRPVPTASSWRPSGLGSVVIPKQPINSQTLKPKHYFVYSDSE